MMLKGSKPICSATILTNLNTKLETFQCILVGKVMIVSIFHLNLDENKYYNVITRANLSLIIFKNYCYLRYIKLTN